MIKKIKSKLSIKVFLITALLMAVCCYATYFFIVCFSPYIYTYELSEVEQIAYELSRELSNVHKAEAPLLFEDVKEMLAVSYASEFRLHFYRSTGEELSLQDLNTFSGKRMDDFDKSDVTTQFKMTFADDQSEYIIFLARNTDKESQVVEALQKALPALSTVILTISTIAAFFYSWYLTAPIKKVSKISKLMADMNFSGFCSNNRTDEVGILSTSLNELSGKLAVTLSELQGANKKLQMDMDRERQLERQRLEFFSAASHELKTPITIIKGQLQGMLCGVGRYKDRETYLAHSLEVTNTLEATVQELLTISRLDTPGYACITAKFDFGKLLNDRLAAHEDLLVQRELTLEQSLAPETNLYGDARLIQKAIDNLIANALTYSPAGNKLFVKQWTEGHKVCLSIENTGVHIPDEAIPRLFEAFYRAEQSRNRQNGGSGLGLYIVKTILALHDAEIQIGNSSHGVIVIIRFQCQYLRKGTPL